MAKRGKKYQEALKKIDRLKKYELSEAVELAKATSITKFDGTVELAFKMNLDPRKAEQNLRGAIVLPYGTGKTRSVLVLTKSPDKQKEATAAGADFGHWYFLFVPVPHRCRRCDPYRPAGPESVCDPRLCGYDRQAVPGGADGCHGSAVLFHQRGHGHYDHLRLLCEEGYRSEQVRQPH